MSGSNCNNVGTCYVFEFTSPSTWEQKGVLSVPVAERGPDDNLGYGYASTIGGAMVGLTGDVFLAASARNDPSWGAWHATHRRCPAGALRCTSAWQVPQARGGRPGRWAASSWHDAHA